jgi:hypothetical protein
MLMVVFCDASACNGFAAHVTLVSVRSGTLAQQLTAGLAHMLVAFSRYTATCRSAHKL